MTLAIHCPLPNRRGIRSVKPSPAKGIECLDRGSLHSRGRLLTLGSHRRKKGKRQSRAKFAAANKLLQRDIDCLVALPFSAKQFAQSSKAALIDEVRRRSRKGELAEVDQRDPLLFKKSLAGRAKLRELLGGQRRVEIDVRENQVPASIIQLQFVQNSHQERAQGGVILKHMEMTPFTLGLPPDSEMAEPTSQLASGQVGLRLFFDLITSNRLEPLIPFRQAKVFKLGFHPFSSIAAGIEIDVEACVQHRRGGGWVCFNEKFWSNLGSIICLEAGGIGEILSYARNNDWQHFKLELIKVSALRATFAAHSSQFVRNYRF